MGMIKMNIFNKKVMLYRYFLLYEKQQNRMLFEKKRKFQTIFFSSLGNGFNQFCSDMCTNILSFWNKKVKHYRHALKSDHFKNGKKSSSSVYSLYFWWNIIYLILWWFFYSYQNVNKRNLKKELKIYYIIIIYY